MMAKKSSPASSMSSSDQKWVDQLLNDTAERFDLERCSITGGNLAQVLLAFGDKIAERYPEDNELQALCWAQKRLLIHFVIKEGVWGMASFAAALILGCVVVAQAIWR